MKRINCFRWLAVLSALGFTAALALAQAANVPLVASADAASGYVYAPLP